MDLIIGSLVCLVSIGAASAIGLITTILAIYWGYTKSSDEESKNSITLKDQKEIN